MVMITERYCVQGNDSAVVSGMAVHTGSPLAMIQVDSRLCQLTLDLSSSFSTRARTVVNSNLVAGLDGLLAMPMARWVLPTPGGPMNTRLARPLEVQQPDLALGDGGLVAFELRQALVHPPPCARTDLDPPSLRRCCSGGQGPRRKVMHLWHAWRNRSASPWACSMLRYSWAIKLKEVMNLPVSGSTQT